MRLGGGVELERLIGWSELDLGGDAREREGCVVLVMERVESGGRGIGWAHHLQGALGQRAFGASEGAGFCCGRKTNISLLGASRIMG